MRFLTGILMFVGVAACVTAVGTPYAPADKKGFGYQDTKIEENRYRVSFAGDGATPPEIVEDFALLRAADIAVDNGFEWFRIVARDVTTQERGGVGVGGGFGTGSYGRRSGVNIGIGGDLGTIGARRFYTIKLEVLYGRGIIPEDGEIYNARSVKENIGGRLARAGAY